MNYYKVKAKPIMIDGGVAQIPVPDVPEDMEYREIHPFPDGVVIETESVLADVMITYASTDPVIVSHVDWWKKDPKSKFEKMKKEKGKYTKVKEDG